MFYPGRLPPHPTDSSVHHSHFSRKNTFSFAPRTPALDHRPPLALVQPQEPCSYSGCSWKEATGPQATQNNATSASSAEPWLRTATERLAGTPSAERRSTTRRRRSSGPAHHCGPAPNLASSMLGKFNFETPLRTPIEPRPQREPRPSSRSHAPKAPELQNLTHFSPVFRVAADTGSLGFKGKRILNAVSVPFGKESQLERSLLYVKLVAR